MEKETSYFDVESWTTLAEKCKTCGRKGRGVRVVGRLRQNRWTDTEGKTKSRVYIVAEHLEFRPESRREGEGSADAYDKRTQAEAFTDMPVSGF